MNNDIVRIGFVGAGENTRLMHIPGFQAIKGVELVSVANRSYDSSKRIADEYNIPNIHPNWLELVEADDTDAICIGTWPYLHCPVTLKALKNNKHVLCEARMAMDATEAKAMLQASIQKPHLITQIVPSPHTLSIDATIQDLITNGYLGKVLSIDCSSVESSFIDEQRPLHWRENIDLSGMNIMRMGIWYEVILRWLGPASSVIAKSKVTVPQRKDADGILRAVQIPDIVDVLADLHCGAVVRLRFSTVTGLGPNNAVWIFGTEGTLKLDPQTLKIYGAQRNDSELHEIQIRDNKQAGWRVEEEFINTIRGKEKVSRTTFEDGLKYMEFTEAVTRSAQNGKAINLPL